MKASFSVHPLICVSTKVVSLSLNKIGRQLFPAVGVIIGQGGAKAGYRYTVSGRQAYHPSPTVLGLMYNFPEIGIEKQICKIRLPFVSLLYPVQKLGTDNAPSTPQQGNVTQLEIPVVRL